MKLPFSVARLPRRIDVLRCREDERAAGFGTRNDDAVGDVSKVGLDAARARAGAEAARAGAAVAVVEDDREPRAAVENSVEEHAKLFVANVGGAGAGVGRDERFIQLVAFVG